MFRAKNVYFEVRPNLNPHNGSHTFCPSVLLTSGSHESPNPAQGLRVYILLQRSRQRGDRGGESDKALELHGGLASSTSSLPSTNGEDVQNDSPLAQLRSPPSWTTLPPLLPTKPPRYRLDKVGLVALHPRVSGPDFASPQRPATANLCAFSPPRC